MHSPVNIAYTNTNRTLNMPDSNYTPLTAHVLPQAEKKRRVIKVSEDKKRAAVAPAIVKATKKPTTNKFLVPAIGTLIKLDHSKVSRSPTENGAETGTPVARIYFDASTNEWIMRYATDPGMLVFLNSMPTTEKNIRVESITPTQTCCYANPTDDE